MRSEEGGEGGGWVGWKREGRKRGRRFFKKGSVRKSR